MALVVETLVTIAPALCLSRISAATGRVAIGLGLILMSLQLIAEATRPLTESLAIRIVSETDVRMSCFNDRAQLGHGLRLRFRPVRERRRRIVIDRKNFTTKLLKPTGRKS